MNKKQTVQLPAIIPAQSTEVHLSMYALYLQIKKLESKLDYLAFYDEITLLPNHKYFKKELTFALINAERNHQKLAVVKIGIDRFKIINDTLGFLHGDSLLKETAHRLLSLKYSAKSISRMNGDEFLLYLEDADDLAIEEFCKRIMNLFKLPFSIDGHELFVSVSIGASVYPYAGHNVHNLIKTADIAMSRVKEEGKNNYKIYHGMLNKFSGQQLTFENELRHALDRNEFSLVYQPQWSVHENEVVGVEALLRWKHPKLGYISPADFIPLAEKLGLIISIGEWVLHEACRQNKEWQDAGLPPFRCSVNVSIAQLLHTQFTQTLTRVLKKTKLDPCYLELEITESIAIVKEDYILKILNNIKQMGMYIAIDDFGTGYSSLKYITQFPINRIKIDQSFIHDHTTVNQAIIKAIITMAHSMNLNVLAEGVETKEQLEFLASQGCNEIQGYYICHPLPHDQAGKLLQNFSPFTHYM
ncbi:putative bifunctional diguanylate cyclase/phosphodiesterase [Fictibacillus aquaticus]|uniref:Diguanylate cyclase n=1 Tax=Fictibacillus aquaticus TaxID=2021314 RepID=A0A235FC64_9BACL|nr:bifunctional diguanylate cyclase/phosphodiesterase [Fictibacillus aquaticus]OYD58624.1 hypothetical protein CGZ90_01605 [Fictibacillus aquaticus]